MSASPSLDDLERAVREKIMNYSCAEEDAFVYAVEDVVQHTLGARTIAKADVDNFVHEVCTMHDINSPVVRVAPSSSRIVGSAHIDQHLLCLSRAKTSVLTVLHEIAHFIDTNDAHGRWFRDSFIRLVREHVGVEHASLLHGLYRRCGLLVSGWETFGRQSR